MLIALLGVLALAALICAIRLLQSAIERSASPRFEAVIVGAVVNFLDTLGIGSMAPTMAWLKLRKLLPDNLIPCTMLVGLTLPTVVEAMIFLVLLGVLVDPVLLVGCSVALLAGALIGAPLVIKTRVWQVQLVVGGALLLAAVFYSLGALHMMPEGAGGGGSLSPPLTVAAIGANFVFGVLLNFGVGNYAPSLVMFSLMGMDPRLAFPIMAGGAALAATGASTRHINIGKIDLRIATGLALGGIPAVLVAAFVVKSMPIETLRWLVIVVVVYTALVMCGPHSKARGRRAYRMRQVLVRKNRHEAERWAVFCQFSILAPTSPAARGMRRMVHRWRPCELGGCSANRRIDQRRGRNSL